MNQERTLLFLRLKQAYRYLNEIGFGLLFVALFILTGIVMNAVQTIMNSPYLYSLIAAVILLLAVEFKRKDQHFLIGIFDTKAALIRYKLLENLMVVLPILIFQLAIQNWIISIYICAICVLISIVTTFFKYSTSNETKISIPFIPLSMFEIKFFFEKKIAILFFLLLALYMGGIHISLWILGIFIVCSLPLEIFSPLEPRIMLIYQPNFVARKILLASKFFFALALPPTIVTAILYDGTLLIFVYGILALFVSITLAIGKKYYDYYGVLEKSPSSTSVLILTFLMLVPGGILITLVASIYYYIRAEKHMKSTYAIT